LRGGRVLIPSLCDTEVRGVLKRFAALTAVLAIGVAACSGAGTNVADPLPHGTAYRLQVRLFPPAAFRHHQHHHGCGQRNVNALESATPPGSTPAISSVARASGTTTQSVKPAATVPNTALVYVVITASAAATISSFPASSFTFANAPTGTVFSRTTTQR